MKIVNLVTYIDDAKKVASIGPVHRAFMADLGEQHRVIAGGPFIDGTGALFIYEVDGLQAAQALFAQDPYSLEGAIASHTMHSWELVRVYPELLSRDSQERNGFKKEQICALFAFCSQLHSHRPSKLIFGNGFPAATASTALRNAVCTSCVSKSGIEIS
jgi:uncharacterized protein YciI